MPMWNPWHGCHKISAGCKHCYVFREDAARGVTLSTDMVRKTSSFKLPLRKTRSKEWKFPSGTDFALCFTSDFLLEEADEWRREIWEIIRIRSDCHFFFFTKRIERLPALLPPDWGAGYENVSVGCTVETQDRAQARLPIFLEIPLKHRTIVVAPMLQQIDLTPWLNKDNINEVSVGGESGRYARPLNYEWVLDLHRQCLEKDIPFCFHQTGSYLLKDSKIYTIPRHLQHSQALKAGLNTIIFYKIR